MARYKDEGRPVRQQPEASAAMEEKKYSCPAGPWVTDAPWGAAGFRNALRGYPDAPSKTEFIRDYCKNATLDAAIQQQLFDYLTH